MTKSRSIRAAEIPLSMLPRAIAQIIRLNGEAVCRISIVWRHWHHYNVSVRMKEICRELVPVPVAVFSAVPGGAEGMKKSGRGCAI